MPDCVVKSAINQQSHKIQNDHKHKKHDKQHQHCFLLFTVCGAIEFFVPSLKSKIKSLLQELHVKLQQIVQI